LTAAPRSVVLVVHGLPPEEASGAPLVADGYARELSRRGWAVTVLHMAPDGPTRGDLRVEHGSGAPYGRVALGPTSAAGEVWSLDAFSEPFAPPPYDGTHPALDTMASLHDLFSKLAPSVVHVVDNVHLPVWIPELAHHMGVPVVRSVSCAEDLCAMVAPVAPGSGPAGYCPAPLTVERCAGCIARSGSPAFAAHLPTGDPAEDERRRDRLLARLSAKEERARLQFTTVYSRVVFASEQFRRYFEGSLELDPAVVRVVPMGVELRRAGPGTPGPGRGDGRLRFVFASAADVAKGVDAVVDAFTHPEVAGRDDWELLLAGGGDRSTFGRLLDDARVTDRGPYGPEELPALLAGADVGLSASYFESFHRVTREYLLAGLPVVGSTAFGITDAVVDGVNGLVFDHAAAGSLRSALTRLLDDPGLVRRLADGARATRVRSVADEVDELEELYRGVTGPAGGGRRDAGAPPGTSSVEVMAGEASPDAPVPGSQGAPAPAGRQGGAGRGTTFAAGAAGPIIGSFRPATVLAAGWGVAPLVQALSDRGVEAEGRECSPDALGALRPDALGRCSDTPLTDPVAGRYDVVVCLGLPAHLSDEEAGRALARLASASDRVLFSPTGPQPTGHGATAPGDGEGPAPLRWLRSLAEGGLAPVLGYDASFLGPAALLFERSDARPAEELLVAADALVRSRTQLDAARADSARLRELVSVDATKAVEVEHRFLRLVTDLEAARAAAEAARREVEGLEATKVMRSTRKARALYSRLRKLLRPLVVPPAPGAGAGGTPAGDRYGLWIGEFDRITEERRRHLGARLARLAHRPTVSVLMPVYDPPERFLRAALDSVLDQIYGEWELCVVDDASTAAWVPKVIDEYVARDARVRAVRRGENGHISAASNTALEMATGEWVALLDHDDVLSEHALALAALALAERPDARLLYSDEDKIDEEGRRTWPFFKPDFDPLLLLAQNYLCHMTMLRRDLAEEIGGFRVGLEGSQDWDLVLRASERLAPGQVLHVPHVLYHWRVHPGSTAAALSEKPYWMDASRRAVSEHLERRGKAGEVSVNGADGLLRVRWRLPADPPKVSIIVPTRDGTYLKRCLDSIFSWTMYPDFEVVVVDNGSVRAETAATLESHRRWVRVLRDDRPFNYSALNNAAVRACAGDLLCLLNDDCEVLEYGWLEELVGQVCQDGVGAAGAKLLYPDGRVQHAGVVLGIGGVAGHAHRFSDRSSVGHFGWPFTARTLSAVTGACMVVRRDAYEALGGLDEDDLGISYNDVDLCLRLGRAGWRVVWTPFAVLVHHESVSRGHDAVVRPDAHFRERSFMLQLWGAQIMADPAYNPNLALTDEQFSLAFPPRSPWWAG
jgi:GT2 family glycosyltransferase/glycosyltransferase involved in cell wall biosynthesis